MSFGRNKSDLIRAFYAADKDGDGALDLFEYVAMFHDQGVNLTAEDARTAFNEKDRDGDGKISLEEFLGKRTDIEKAWNALDSDRNGFITAKEISQGARKFKKALPRMITFQNGQYFIEKLQERSNSGGKSNLDDTHARVTSDKPITFEDFSAVMRDIEREDSSWMEPERSEASPSRHSSHFRKSSEPKSRTNSAMIGPRSESVMSASTSERLPALNRSNSLQESKL